MAKALKLPRTFKGGAGREVAQSSTTRSVQEILRVSPAPELEENRQASVGRLTQLCQRPSAADSSLRMERIAAIQKSIAAGTHRISAADLADKLIAHIADEPFAALLTQALRRSCSIAHLNFRRKRKHE